MRGRIGAVLAALLCTASPRPLPACSLAEGVLLPTNYELVQETETIVLARAAQEAPLADGGADMRFTVLETLRGRYPENFIALRAEGRFAGASPEEDFSKARPGAYAGSCNAFDYRVGGLYVLFLEQRHGRWDLNRRHAFSRINEEVGKPTSPWVLAVRSYSRAADLGSYERSKQALQETARRSGAALARDIALHLATPTAAKSESDLLKLYAGARRREARRQVLWALAQRDGEATAAFFGRLIARPRVPEWALDPVCSWSYRYPDAANLASVLRQSGDQRPGERGPCLLALAVLANAESFEAIRPVLNTLDVSEAGVFFSQADGLATVKEAREAIRRRLHGDYANGAELTIALARWGDPETLAWALAKAREPGDARWAAGQALAASPLPHAELTEIVAHGDAAIASILLSGLSGSKRDDRLELIEEALARFPDDHGILRVARGTLRALDAEGVAGAAGLLESLPVPDGEIY